MADHINPARITEMENTITQQQAQITTLAETMKSMAETQVELAKSNQSTVEALKLLAAQTGTPIEEEF